MNLFNTIALEISARCNRTCSFCPVAYNTRPNERMDPALLVKALNELGTMRYHGRIELYIYNEPLQDMPYALHCIAMARAAVPRACLMIATNGDYLHPDAAFTAKVYSLFDAGLNQLLINCYSDGLYARRLPLLQRLPKHIMHDGSVYSVGSAHVKTVQMLDKSHADTFGQGIFRLINRAGNIPDFLPPTAQPVQRMCVKPFRMLNINWQGEALLCCNDYHGQLHIGNVRDYTLEQLWNSPVLNTYRKHLLQKQRDLPLCRVCDCHAGAYPHNVPHPEPNARYLSNAAIENRFTKEKP